MNRVIVVQKECSFGEAIKAQRMKRSLSITQLAKLAGVSPGAISRWESNKRTPSMKTFNAVMTALGAELYVVER